MYLKPMMLTGYKIQRTKYNVLKISNPMIKSVTWFMLFEFSCVFCHKVTVCLCYCCWHRGARRHRRRLVRSTLTLRKVSSWLRSWSTMISRPKVLRQPWRYCSVLPLWWSLRLSWSHFGVSWSFITKYVCGFDQFCHSLRTAVEIL